jgi:DNA polymerase-3 subunit beta
MNISIDKDELKNIISKLNPLISNNKDLPILSNFLIVALENGNIDIMANNIQTGAKATLLGIVTEPGKVCVSADIFYDTINKMPYNGYVTLSTDDGSKALKITCGKASLEIGLTEKPDEFPVIQEHEVDKSITLKCKELKKLIAKVIFSVSSDESRPTITGVNFKINSNTLILGTTDGYRISKVWTSIEAGDIQEEFIVPSKTLLTLLKALDGETVDICKANNFICFKTGNLVFSSMLIADQFLDYEKVLIQSSEGGTLDVAIKSLTSSIEFASIATKEKRVPVRFKLGESFTVTAVSAKTKTNDEIEEFTYNGKEMEICFNSIYFLDILKVIEDERVNITISDALRPIIINGENYTYLLLPIKAN